MGAVGPSSGVDESLGKVPSLRRTSIALLAVYGRSKHVDLSDTLASNLLRVLARSRQAGRISRRGGDGLSEPALRLDRPVRVRFVGLGEYDAVLGGGGGASSGRAACGHFISLGGGAYQAES